MIAPHLILACKFDRRVGARAAQVLPEHEHVAEAFGQDVVLHQRLDARDGALALELWW